MLGLGNAITSSGAPEGLPPLSFDVSTSVFLTPSTFPDSGSTAPTAAGNSLFDIRLQLIADYEASDVASNFVFNNITVENLTESSGPQTISSGPLSADSVVDVNNLGVAVYVFDASSPMNDVDLGSTSGATAAHNGSSTNVFRVSFDVSKVGYSGTVSFQKDFSLTDSDA